MGKIKDNQQGFSPVEAVLVLVIVGLVGFTGWYVLHSQKSVDKNLTSTSSSQATAKSTTPVKTSKNIIKFPELGIQITVPDDLNDLTYSIRKGTYDNNATFIGANLSTKHLEALDANCSESNSALGGLFRTEGKPPTSETTETGPSKADKQFPTFYVSYAKGNGTVCSDKEAVMAERGVLIANLQSSLPTIEQLQ